MDLIAVVHIAEGRACHPAAILGGRIILAIAIPALVVVTGEGAGVSVVR